MPDARLVHQYACQGYINLGKLVDDAFLKQANARIDRWWAERKKDKIDWREGYVPECDTYLFRHLRTRCYLNPLLDWLDYLLGERWEIDQYTLQVYEGHNPPVVAGLHGPAWPYDRRQQQVIREGHVHETMVVVALSLVDVNPGDGGLAVVPGSQHVPLRFRPEWTHLADWPDNHPYPVTQVTCRAGEVVLFSEATVHGTLPWRGAGTRRTLFAKPMARGMYWSTDRRQLLEVEHA